MSRLQTLRLAQYWRTRLQPLLGYAGVKNRFFAAEVYEAVGWLIEGVFCGFFDARETDIAWTRFEGLVTSCPDPDYSAVSEFVVGQIRQRLGSHNPFLESQQMTGGSQRDFELPLFSHALLISDRFALDRLASVCLELLYSASAKEWSAWQEHWPQLVSGRGFQAEEIYGFGLSSENGEILVEILETLRTPGPFDSERYTLFLLAGYFRMLEHMEASRRFFDYARQKAGRAVDFDSYCQRIGALNAWRVPLVDSEGRDRFAVLPNLVEFFLRPILSSQASTTEWQNFQRPFAQNVVTLTQAWEAHHLTAFLVTY